MKINKHLLVAAACFSLTIGMANALTETYTVSSTTVTFTSGLTLGLTQFNPGLGTLDSVTLVLSLTNPTNNFATITNSGAYAVTDANFSLTLKIKLDSADAFSAAIDAYNTGGAGKTWIQAANSDSTTIASGAHWDFGNTNLASLSTGPRSTGLMTDNTVKGYLTGTGTVNLLALGTNTINTGGSTTGSLQLESNIGSTGGLTGVITYNYTAPPPVVPEPSTWMLLVGGLGSLALVRHLRTRKA